MTAIAPTASRPDSLGHANRLAAHAYECGRPGAKYPYGPRPHG